MKLTNLQILNSMGARVIYNMKICSMKNKKASMSLATVILVILTLLLLVSSLVTFSMKKAKIEETISSPKEIENAYLEAEIIKFHLRQISEKIGKDNPIEDFTKELENYKNSKGLYVVPDLIEVNSQLNSKHIRIDGNYLKIDLDLVRSEQGFSSDVSKVKEFSLVYNYHFSYERRISSENPYGNVVILS